MLVQSLPYKIFRHVRKNFKGNNMLSARQWKDVDNNIFYEVEVGVEDLVYYLKFNKDGMILREMALEKFPEGQLILKN